MRWTLKPTPNTITTTALAEQLNIPIKIIV